MNLAALNSNNSYCYLTKNDFVSAFGNDDTILITKDYTQFKFNFESDSQESNSLLLNSHKQTELRDVHIIGDVLRPTQLKLVNSEAKSDSDSNLLLCFDNIPSDDDNDDNVPKRKMESKVHKANSKQIKKAAPIRSFYPNIFRRRIKPKKFLELDEAEREQLASRVLHLDRFKDKSMFYFVNDKQLVSSTDYIEPDFITLCQPPDSDYELSYSTVAPNIHDLFDIDIDPIHFESDQEDSENHYEMIEYLDDDS